MVTGCCARLPPHQLDIDAEVMRMDLARGGWVMPGQRRRSLAPFLLAMVLLMIGGALLFRARDIAITPVQTPRETTEVAAVCRFFDALNEAIANGDSSAAEQ